MRTPRPRTPGRAGDLDDIFALNQSVPRRSAIEAGASRITYRQIFHLSLTRLVGWDETHELHALSRSR